MGVTGARFPSWFFLSRVNSSCWPVAMSVNPTWCPRFCMTLKKRRRALFGATRPLKGTSHQNPLDTILLYIRCAGDVLRKITTYSVDLNSLSLSIDWI